MSRDIHDYTIEVCAICGCQLGRGTRAGRCENRDHWYTGGMVVHVIALPLSEQKESMTKRHWHSIPAKCKMMEV